MQSRRHRIGQALPKARSDPRMTGLSLGPWQGRTLGQWERAVLHRKLHEFLGDQGESPPTKAGAARRNRKNMGTRWGKAKIRMERRRLQHCWAVSKPSIIS
jgi:hypothetical protein